LIGKLNSGTGLMYPNGGLNGGLNEMLLTVIEKTPGIQLKEILNLTQGNSKRTVERQIAELVKNGLIERRGSRKTGGYFVVERKEVR
jgi:ATP-dependent DNA helicase RecG